MGMNNIQANDMGNQIVDFRDKIMSTEGKLRIHENIAFRAVCLITVPYHYTKMIAEVVCGFFLGVAALLFGCQSTMFNELALGMFRRSGDSFRKIGLNACGVFAPNWAIKQITTTNVNALANVSTFLV